MPCESHIYLYIYIHMYPYYVYIFICILIYFSVKYMRIYFSSLASPVPFSIPLQGETSLALFFWQHFWYSSLGQTQTPLREPTSQESPHLQTQLQAIPVLSSLYPFLINFSSLPSPVHSTGFSLCFFPGFLAIFALMSSKNNYSQNNN